MSPSRPGHPILLALACSALLVAADEARERPLNDGWRFLRGDPADASRPDCDDRTWRTVDLPHDWSIEDLPTREQDGQFATIDLVPGSWRFQPGDDAAWSKTVCDDRAWRIATLPESWDKHGQDGGEAAVGWYRRAFTIPAHAAGKQVIITVGRIHDQDVTHVDGIKVGASGEGYWSANFQKSRCYVLPAHLAKPGDHVVAVRVTGGKGHAGGIVAAVEAPTGPGPCDPGRSAGGINTGYAVGGVGWYRTSFTLSATEADRQVRLVFDGAYMHTTVWCNGVEVGRNRYGYAPFGCDLTPHLRPAGQANALAVRVANQGANSRWYSGSGIFRPVHLEVTGALRIAPWGVAITTPDADATTARVQVRVELAGPSAGTLIQVVISDDAGRVVARGEGPAAEGVATLALAITQPRCWSPDTPTLYHAAIAVQTGTRTADRTVVPFGIRTIAWNAERGFLLNGRMVELKGACIHHDHGPLGAAAFARAEERRVELLKAAGYNAIRTSHGHPPASLLDACDRLGMLVVDEAFDMWREGKNPDDHHRDFDACWRQDLDALVRRDRNHPSVVMWSIGNELPDRYKPEGAAMARMLADRIRSSDATRPITAAFNGVNDKADAFFAALDIAGYNYNPEKYEPDHRRHPQRVMMATESYPRDSFHYWSLVGKHPYVVGDFVWTAWDYRGESGIGHTFRDGQPNGFLMPWPWHNAFCGDFDVCGHAKPQGLYRQVLWGARPIAMVVEEPQPTPTRPDLWGWRDEWASWTWPGQEGRAMTVRVHATAGSVRLALDGSGLGIQAVGPERTATFTVPYRAGVLSAQAMIDGRVVAEECLTTTGPATALRLSADRSAIPAARDGLAFVTVEAVDARGVPVPRADLTVEAVITGSARLAAFGNGDPTDVASLQDARHRLWRGRGLIVVRSTGAAGDSTCTVTASGLTPASVRITHR